MVGYGESAIKIMDIYFFIDYLGTNLFFCFFVERFAPCFPPINRTDLGFIFFFQHFTHCLNQTATGNWRRVKDFFMKRNFLVKRTSPRKNPYTLEQRLDGLFPSLPTLHVIQCRHVSTCVFGNRHWLALKYLGLVPRWFSPPHDWRSVPV